MESIIKPTTQNKTGRLTFYIFEIAGAAFFGILFIAAIVVAALTRSFMTWLEYFMAGIIICLVLYGLGRLIDLSYTKVEALTCECDCGDDCDCHHEHEEK